MDHLSYPNESADYRAARKRPARRGNRPAQQTEAVAALRRALPAGGLVAEDYEFERIGTPQRG
ncbi:DUF899 family protein [Phenylobacterium immobile]|uniref:DUF899 family protein n=1 Tax=Phenylobacterium immobile TaxID=21 RepID=UPI000AF6094A|nr:DUF899 family protein [Phenylobacterium immobile]